MKDVITQFLEQIMAYSTVIPKLLQTNIQLVVTTIIDSETC